MNLFLRLVACAISIATCSLAIGQELPVEQDQREPGFEEDKWVTAAEILPGERTVLHHSIVFIRPPDGDGFREIGWLAAYVPGQSAPTFNPEFGRRIPAGSRLVFQQRARFFFAPSTWAIGRQDCCRSS